MRLCNGAFHGVAALPDLHGLLHVGDGLLEAGEKGAADDGVTDVQLVYAGQVIRDPSNDNGADEVGPDSVETLAQGVLLRKAVTPPSGWWFRVFSDNLNPRYVALQPMPDWLPMFGSADFVEGDYQIKITVAKNTTEVTAGEVAFDAAANLGSTGSGGAAPHVEWKGKAAAIVATIPATPCKTIRAPMTENPKPRDFTSIETTATWEAKKSIVLIEKSVDQIPLKATVAYGSPKWKVERNPADNTALKQAPYPAKDILTLTDVPNKPAEKSLVLDAVGSFSVICYDDKNNNGTVDNGEPAVYLNVVVARVIFVSDHSVPYPNNIKSELEKGNILVDGNVNGPVDLIRVKIGEWPTDPNDPIGQPGMKLSTKLNTHRL